MSEISLFDNGEEKVSYLDEMSESFIDYAMSVITSRALPDLRDGLKPVQRRIILAMHEEGLAKKFSKCAGIVGEVLKKWHPHGDSAVYEALVRLAQDWVMKLPLVQGQGNFGSIDGDLPAAYRYTEAKLSPITEFLLKDLEKDTVDKIHNYNGTDKEPLVFPTVFPNLLLNGSSGIAVGMATNIPPHNITEVMDALLVLLEDEKLSNEDLMEYIKGPDFPTGATIIGVDGIKDAYLTGKGSLKVRGIIETEKNKDKLKLVIKEIPYGVIKSRITSKIVELIKNKKIEGIVDIRDESDKNGIRLVLELRKNAPIDLIEEKLFKLTPLESFFSINLLALIDGKPKLLKLKEILLHFINFRKEIVRRRTVFDLRKAKERILILEGFKKVLDFKDEYLKKILPVSKSKDGLKELIEERFLLDKVQSEAVVILANYKFSSMEVSKIMEEYDLIKQQIEALNEILLKEAVLIKIIKKEFLDIKTKFKQDRKTKILENFESKKLIDLIPDQKVLVSLTYGNFIKRYNIESEVQERDSRVVFIGDDVIKKIVVGNTAENILVFTKNGRLTPILCFNIQELRRYGKGLEVSSFIKNLENKDVMNIEAFSEDDVLFLTKASYFKKLNLNEFKTIKAKGSTAFSIRKNDELIFAGKAPYKNLALISEKNEILVKNISELTANKTAQKLFNPLKAFFFFDDETKDILLLDKTGDIESVSFKDFLKKYKSKYRDKYILPINNGDELIIFTSEKRFLNINKNTTKVELGVNELIINSFIFNSLEI